MSLTEVQASTTQADAIVQNADPSAILASNAEAAPSGTEVSPVETKPELPKDPAKDERFSQKFAVLTKKERQIQLRERAIAERERKLADLEKSNGKADSPEEALKRLGWTYEELTQYYLQGKEPENKKIRDIEQKLKDAEEARQREKEEAAKAEEARAVATYRASIKEHCLKAGDSFELINSYDAHDTVYDVMKQDYESKCIKDESGKIIRWAPMEEALTIQQAAEMVEKYFENELEKAFKLKKLQAKIKPAETNLKPTNKPENQTGNSGTPAAHARTLSNSDSQGTTTAVNRPTTREEDMRLAIKMLTA